MTDKKSYFFNPEMEVDIDFIFFNGIVVLLLLVCNTTKIPAKNCGAMCDTFFPLFFKEKDEKNAIFHLNCIMMWKYQVVMCCLTLYSSYPLSDVF